jgi:DNA-binding phage protein
MMALTRSFSETVKARALKDPEFRQGLLTESIECMLMGDLKTGKALLRDYINALMGFQKLAKLTKKDPKSLMRMLSSSGNPTASNLFDLIYALEKKEKIRCTVQAVK